MRDYLYGFHAVRVKINIFKKIWVHRHLLLLNTADKNPLKKTHFNGAHCYCYISVRQYQYTTWVQTTASRLLTCFCCCFCTNTSASFTEI